jgi:hypothetical protein
VKVGSVALLAAAGSGYGIGLTDDGHLVEALGDWAALTLLLGREAKADRARFLRSAPDRQADP